LTDRLAKKLVIIVLGILSPLITLGHAGHSHSPTARSSSNFGKARSQEPLSLVLSLRGGYDQNTFTSILPEIGAYFGNKTFGLNPGYRFQFAQFVSRSRLKEDSSNPGRNLNQFSEHSAWLNFSKKISDRFAVKVNSGMELKTFGDQEAELNDIFSFNVNPIVQLKIAKNNIIEIGYQLESRNYPNGTISAPPLSEGSESIVPKNPLEAKAIPEIIVGVNDLEHSFYLGHAQKISRYTLAGNLRGNLNRSTDFDRDYDGFRITASVGADMWKDASTQIEQQTEWRRFEKYRDTVNSTELVLEQKLTKKITFSLLAKRYLVSSLGDTTWEGFVELRSVF